MKVHVYCDERYPVYGLATEPSQWNRTIEISDELHAEIVAAEAAYDAVQDKLHGLSKEHNRAPPPPERITQAEIDTIKASTPVEDEAAIQAAIDAVKLRAA